MIEIKMNVIVGEGAAKINMEYNKQLVNEAKAIEIKDAVLETIYNKLDSTNVKLIDRKNPQ